MQVQIAVFVRQMLLTDLNYIATRYLIELEKLVKVYNNLQKSMSSIETTILCDHIKRMDDVLKPSFTILNWSSQGVHGFITKANNAIDKFKPFLKEMRKNFAGESVIFQI